MNAGFGFVVTPPRTSEHRIIYAESGPAGRIACSYRAEMRAISEALRWLVDNPNEMGRILICSDSLSALHRLKGLPGNDPIETDARKILSYLKRVGKVVRFMWVKAHMGLWGNEEADKRAKEGATGDRLS